MYNILMRPTYSVVIPCYNHGALCVRLLKEIMKICTGRLSDMEIIVVTDGSPDATETLITALSRRHRKVRGLFFERRLGKGGAIREGVKVAQGKYIAFIDADLVIHPRYLKACLDALTNDSSLDLIIGCRSDYHTTAFRFLASRVYRCVNMLFFWLPLHDTQTGLKAFRAPVAHRLFSALRVQGYAFDIDILLNAHRQGCRIGELSVIQTKRAGSNVTLRSIFRMIIDTMQTYHREIYRDLHSSLSGFDSKPLTLLACRHIFLYPVSWLILAAAWLCELPLGHEHPVQGSVEVLPLALRHA